MSHDWEREALIVSIDSPWVRMIAERWRDERGRQVDYWRVERAHSVIVATIQNGRLLLPHPQFRPGLGRATLDLPGGRLNAGQSIEQAARQISARELGHAPAAVGATYELHSKGWPINSSFNNQLLFAVVAELDPAVDPSLPYDAVPYDRAGLSELLRRLECLQCRAVVYELLLRGEFP